MKKLIIFGSTIMLCLGVFALKSLLNSNVGDILIQNVEALAQPFEQEEVVEDDGGIRCYKTLSSDGPLHDITNCSGCRATKAASWGDKGRC